jgi:recombination protein RecA
VKKNKVAPPYKLAEFDILFGSGISAVGCMLDAAEAVAVVQRRGSWYYFGEQRLAQGRDKTLDVIKEDGELRGWV